MRDESVVTSCGMSQPPWLHDDGPISLWNAVDKSDCSVAVIMMDVDIAFALLLGDWRKGIFLLNFQWRNRIWRKRTIFVIKYCFLGILFFHFYGFKSIFFVIILILDQQTSNMNTNISINNTSWIEKVNKGFAEPYYNFKTYV